MERRSLWEVKTLFHSPNRPEYFVGGCTHGLQKTWFHNIYIRMDRGDEVISTLLDICQKEHIQSATYNGIGGCSAASIQTFDPASGSFHTEEKTGMLELVSMMGNVVTDGDHLYHHTHALFSYVEDGEHKVLGGHLKETVVLYTAEIELRPVDGVIGRKRDPETGTGFWSFG